MITRDTTRIVGTWFFFSLLAVIGLLLFVISVDAHASDYDASVSQMSNAALSNHTSHMRDVYARDTKNCASGHSLSCGWRTESLNKLNVLQAEMALRASR